MGHVTVLNLDQSYHAQSFLQRETYEWMDLESIPNTNLFCERDTLCKITQKLEEYKRNRITFLGSGNYHYISYLYLSKIQQPFTLVLFDHHTDMYPAPSDSLISCGSWVLDSIQKLPLLKKVILIGVNDDWTNHTPLVPDGKVAVYPKDSIHGDYASIIRSMVNEIPTRTVYISIDKDVLNKHEAYTAWDHGTMNLHELMVFVKGIVCRKEICGMDICGEFPVNPTNAYKKQTIQAIEKNEHANKFILEHVMELPALKHSGNSSKLTM